MKKQSALTTNIPTNPRTFSGQWMTFSHMANHYRKLVNVKPRVDTGMTRSRWSSMSNLNQSPKRTRSKLSLHRAAGFYSSTETMLTDNRNCGPPPAPVTPVKRHKFNSENSRRSNCENPKCSSARRSDRFEAGDQDSICSENCQVLYGPVSMKRSADALPVDTGASLEQILSEPQLKTISIGEKIRRFLNHIHSQEQIATKPKLIKRSTKPSVPPPSSRPLLVRSQRSGQQQRVEESLTASTSTGGDRHSCCFTSYKVSRRTSRLSGEDTTTSPVKRTSREILKESSSCQTASANLPKRSSLRSAPPPPITLTSEEDHVAFQGLLAAFGNRRTLSITKPLSQRASLINPSNARKFTKPSFASPQSIGTIHGSDDLAEEVQEEQEDLLQHSSGCINNNSSEPAAAAPWVQDKIAKANIPNNECFRPHSSSNQQSSPSASSSNTSVPQSSKSSSSGAASGSNVPHHHNNKDSSRDSAYGFSSGESRITTRESTPEKRSRIRSSQSSSEPPPPRSRSSSFTTIIKHPKSKYKSTLSTVASSANQEDHNSSSISQLESLSDSCDSLPREGYGTNIKKLSSRSKKSISAKMTPPDKLEDNRYLQFLTLVTDDIVSRGVYTNKGIKNVFKFHMANHADLNEGKMMSLLEQLRIDMGVPKEASLDRLEFGYGSVKYSSGPYFRKGSLETPPSSRGSPGSSENEPEIIKASSKNKGKASNRSSRKTSVVSIPDLEQPSLEEESLFEREAEFEDHNHFLIDA